MFLHYILTSQIANAAFENEWLSFRQTQFTLKPILIPAFYEWNVKIHTLISSLRWQSIAHDSTKMNVTFFGFIVSGCIVWKIDDRIIDQLFQWILIMTSWERLVITLSIPLIIVRHFRESRSYDRSRHESSKGSNFGCIKFSKWPVNCLVSYSLACSSKFKPKGFVSLA